MTGPVARYDQMADFYEQGSGKSVSESGTGWCWTGSLSRLLSPKWNGGGLRAL